MISAHASVLLVTVSVQGLVVAAQLLAATVVEPTVLGQIRWLESVFAIAVLATSCGMPSLTFREAALVDQRDGRARWVVDATVLTSIASFFGILIGLAAWFFGLWSVPDWAGPMLLFMGVVLIPANAARVAVASVQGAQLSRQHAPRLLGFSLLGIALLACGSVLGGARTWVILRIVIEGVLVGLIWWPLFSGVMHGFSWKTFSVAGLFKLFSAGFGANYAFLVRVLADNLPLLLLSNVVGMSVQVGWYGLANLLLFAPMLLMSTAMQSRLPALIQNARDEVQFTALTSAAIKGLLIISMQWCSVLLVGSAILRTGWLLPQYAGAGDLIAVLALGLPARALVLVAGATSVAHGWFARSSVLTLTEIAIVAFALFQGIQDATQMAVAVSIALWVTVLPSGWIIAAARKAC